MKDNNLRGIIIEDPWEKKLVWQPTYHYFYENEGDEFESGKYEVTANTDAEAFIRVIELITKLSPKFNLEKEYYAIWNKTGKIYFRLLNSQLIITAVKGSVPEGIPNEPRLLDAKVIVAPPHESDYSDNFGVREAIKWLEQQ